MMDISRKEGLLREIGREKEAIEVLNQYISKHEKNKREHQKKIDFLERRLRELK